MMPKTQIQIDYPHMFDCHFFGNDVGPGWMPIVEEAVKALAALENPPQIVQVKEKFGDLRIYITSYTVDSEFIVNEAARKASTVCEDCGAPGEKSAPRGWLKILCPDCAVKRSNR